MKKQLSAEEALARLQAQCSIAERCISEVQVKLLRWNIPADDAAAIVQQLVKARFIDERRYARAFVNDKSKFSKWGSIKIKMSLMAKKIPSTIVTEALQEMDEEENKETLVDLLQKKAKTTKADNSRELFAKLMRFGLSKGYEYDMVCRAVGTICKEGEID